MTKQASTAIQVAGVRIRQDFDGRFRINDLHKAAGGEKRHQPSDWLRIQQTKELIEAVENSGNSRSIPVESVEGRNGGTFVCKELVYAYAMWVSAEFHLHVIRTFDDLVTGKLAAVESRQSRERARLEAPAMTDAIKFTRAAAGKPIAAYHFSNEFDLINRIALGQPAKVYRAVNGIGQDAPLRDYLTPCQIKCVEHLQRTNAALIDVGMPFEDRKAQLSKIYMQRHSRPLLAEVKRMEF